MTSNLDNYSSQFPSVYSNGESVVITSFNQLCHESKLRIERVLTEADLIRSLEVGSFDNIQVPNSICKDGEIIDLASIIGVIVEEDGRKSIKANTKKNYPDEIDFDRVNAQALQMADYIEHNKKNLIDVLTQYETHEVANDEIERTLDLLRSLSENKAYFKRRIGGIGSFLPINQPLYALACFSMVPSLMADQVLVRPPVEVRQLFSEINDALKLKVHFPNIEISNQDRADFIETCKVGQVEVIIFTGKMENAYKVRKSFSEDVLFIVNGAGHNPIVVSNDADLDSAVSSALRVQLYNQGQDCANPSAILVHRQVVQGFLQKLRGELSGVIVGSYEDPKVRVGPISNPKDLGRIVGLLNKNRSFVDPATPGIMHAKTGLVEPIIISKPLEEGGNYTEQMAPIFFVHEYETDESLSDYFENDTYSQNAMYVSLFGTSQYVDNLTGFHFSDGRRLHDQQQIIRNKDIHAKGVERGTQPYGGYGRRASCLIINGRFMPKPTLPQRDIFEQLVQPVLSAQESQTTKTRKDTSKKIQAAVERTLVLKAKSQEKPREATVLDEKNITYVGRLEGHERLERIRELRRILATNELKPDKIMEHIYRLDRSDRNDTSKTFFLDLYNLLIGRNAGPRISTLICGMNRDQLLKLLDI